MSFDPAGSPGAASYTRSQYLPPVYGYLLYEDYVTGKVVPQMAESMTTSDATHWLLRLRSGVRFSDGSSYDANAVMVAWNRIAASPRRATVAQIGSMTVSDPLTLNITLRAPNSAFDRFVAQNLTFIPSTAIVANPSRFTRNAIGAGPFTLQSFAADGTAVFARNPTYWDQPRPYLDQLTIKSIPDDGQRYTAFASSTAGLTTLGAIQKTFAKHSGFSVASIGAPGGGTSILWNTTRAPFNNPIARRAVQYAFDNGAANRALSDGTVVAMPSLFKKTSPFYVASAKFVPHDPKQAQALFNQYATQTGKPMAIFSVVALSFSRNEW